MGSQVRILDRAQRMLSFVRAGSAWALRRGRGIFQQKNICDHQGRYLITMEQHFVGKIAQKALIEKEGKILLVQYPQSESNSASGKWDLPGGRLNINENPIESLKREVREELGVEIEV